MIILMMASLQVTAEERSSWFTPSLTLDESPVCAQFEAAVKADFESQTRHLLPKDFGSRVEGNVKIDGQQIFIGSFTHRGCGGACERYSITASLTPLPQRLRWKTIKETENLAISEPSLHGRNRFVELDGGYFNLRVEQNDVMLSQLSGEPTWEKVCQVKIGVEPDSLPERFSGIRSQLTKLAKHTASLLGAPQSCGSMQTRSRWSRAMGEEFSLALLRPWVVRESPNTAYPEGSFGYRDGLFEHDMENLAVWAVQGESEWRTYQALLTLLNQSKTDYAIFLKEEFSLPNTEAKNLSKQVIEAATSVGLRFYRYRPYVNKDEITLRRAILENGSIEDIKELATLDVLALHSENRGQGNDSILNIALKRLDVLQYLLNAGVNVNQKNVFGKTPLMYAAQNDAIEATQLLLAAGAETSAATILNRTVHRCEVNLATSDITALHYAARYSSPELIETLVTHGAPISAVSNSSLWKAETPLEWFEHFMTPARESEFSAGELEKVRELLTLSAVRSAN